MPHRFSLRHAALIVWTLGWADFTARYHRSFLGYVWSFSLPVVKLIVLFYVFRPFIGEDIRHYPLYIFVGLIVWEHFSLVTNKCIGVLREKSALVQRVSFPRVLLVLAAGCTALLVALTYVVVYVVCAWMLDAPLGPSVLYLLVLLLQMTLFGLGVGMFLAAYSLRFPDLEHLWNMGLQILFWLTPIIYPHALRGPLAGEVAHVVEQGRFASLGWMVGSFIHLQPLSVIIHDARRALLYAENIGVPSFVHILGVTGMLSLVFFASAVVFVRRSPYFLQEY